MEEEILDSNSKNNNIKELDKKTCTGCMACKNVCHKNAIIIKENNEGFKYPEIDENLCINCGLCKKVCPVLTKLQENENEIKVYSCKNKNEEVRMKSSSGGIFTLIAKYIIENNGVVFGARFNESLEVVHDYIENIDDIGLFRGSKYVQSYIGDSYKKVREFLNNNKKVLFTGTPCQVEGLLTYLGKDYDNLYTQDFVCHGVPSPKVWRKYLEYKKYDGSYPININFRRKDILGWSNYQVSYKYSNKEENIHHDNDPYMKIFLKNLSLRMSCFNCKFKKIKRKSDITVADFWGINNVKPEMNDETGISALLVNSKKGLEIFENIKEDMIFEEANIEDIIKYNSCISKSTNYNEKREEFFKDLETISFEKLIDKYL